jgi:hypothetical protein
MLPEFLIKKFSKISKKGILDLPWNLCKIYPVTVTGLSIVSRIIKRHGGEIWAEGEEGTGATFFFTLL